MTDYFFNSIKFWREDNAPVFDLTWGDTLTFGTSAKIQSIGQNAPIARMTESVRIKIEGPASFPNTSFTAADTAFYATGGNIAFGMNQQTVVQGQKYALAFMGSGNLIEVGHDSSIFGGSEAASNAKAIYSGGWSTIINQGNISAFGEYATAINLTDGNNKILSQRLLYSDHAGISIHGSNNTIENTSFLRTKDGQAIFITASEGGANTIVNTGQISAQNGRSISAVRIEGPSNDTINNIGTADIDGRIDLGGGDDSIMNDRHATIWGEVDFGSGNDTLENNGFIQFDVRFGEGSDLLDNRGYIYASKVHLGDGNDQVINSGGIAANLYLGNGNDTYVSRDDGYYRGIVRGMIDGGAGHDKIYGGILSDRINGGDGIDTLTGGGSGDVFIFESALGTVDTITDFEDGSDRIELSKAVFTQLELGYLRPSAFRYAAAAPQAASDRIGYDVASGYVWYDPDGTGSAKTVMFAKLQPSLWVNAYDFFVV